MQSLQHDAVERHGTDFSKLGWPDPKFWFGDRVLIRNSEAVVSGCSYTELGSPEHFLGSTPGWWYMVQYLPTAKCYQSIGFELIFEDVIQPQPAEKYHAADLRVIRR